MCKLFLFCVIYVFHIELVSGQLFNHSVCYGDSSGGSNLVKATCSTGVINVNASGIIAGSKQTSLGCPTYANADTHTNKTYCCEYGSNDCLVQYEGDVTNYLSCNGLKLCTRTVIFTRHNSACSSNVYMTFTNYMIFQYRCVPDHNLHGACNSTEDCLDEHAICDKSVCICGPGTTENNDKCFLDGTPGGLCNQTISCNGSSISCINSVCRCNGGFTAIGYFCREDGSLNGKCSATIPCTDDKAVCTDGFCECVTGYEERDSACFKSNIELINSSYCYGDSSNGQNLVNVSCDEGVIRLYNIIAGSKPLRLGCPSEDHIYTPAEQASCCTYNETDCLTTYTGDWSTYLACNGHTSCHGLPIIRIQTDPLCNVTMNYSYKGYSNYMIFQYYCVPDYRLHGACNTTEECTDDNTLCNSSICLCRQDATEVSDTCIPDGEVGGRCSNSIACKDSNADCSSDGICRCNSGYSANGFTCIQDGHVGGFCNSTIQCVDSESFCSDNICVCNTTGYTQREFTCIPDGSVGGRCIDDVCNDTATICSSNNMCECNETYTEVDRTCKKDGDALGKCNPDSSCNDENSECNASSGLECGITECDPGVCTCLDGYSVNTDGICVKDGSLGGKCSSVIACNDSNTMCSSDLVCVCTAGYTEYNGECVEDGTLGGRCINGVTCSTSYTVCSASGSCECKTEFSEVNRTCKEDGGVGGKCNSNGTCNNVLTTCEVSTVTNCGLTSCNPGVCLCIDDYSAKTGDTCIKDGDIGGSCSNSIVCRDSNAECSTDGTCECKQGYSANGNTCIQDGQLGGYCNNSITCVGGRCTSDNVCECLSGHTQRNFVCIPDGNVGGSCVNGVGGQCTQANTMCNDTGTCVCVSDHSEVNRICVEDGDTLGKCLNNRDCDDTHAECNSDSGLECGTSQCDPGVCTCVTGYSPHVDDGTCVQDGSVGGQCSSTIPCRDINSTCVGNTCSCNSGYIEHNRQCVEDGSVGGRCSSDADCVDSNAVCSTDNVCVCSGGYTEVNRRCEQDGVVGGVCDTNKACTGNHVVCIDDNGSQCGGVTCNPGICVCTTGYSEVISGTCSKDGDLGGRCDKDDDCNDASAVCNATSSVCVCKSGFTEINTVCKQDGMPDGVCLTSGMSPCLDAHSVCSSGICRCNDARDYQNNDGTCKKKDDEIHGTCQSTSGCLSQSINSFCGIDGVCTCATGYGTVNGQCVADSLPSVTSCEGSSPYNALQPECPPGRSAIVLRELSVVKPASTNCPVQMNTYSEAQYQKCCTSESGDCIVYTSIATDCDSSVTYLTSTNYRILEYVCSKGDDTIEVDDDDKVTGSPVFLTSPGYPGDGSTSQSEHRCSAQASCITNINVVVLLQNNQNCEQKLEIIEGQTDTSIPCSHTSTLTPVYTSQSSHVIIKLTNTNLTSSMKFVMKFEPEVSTADVDVSCGSNIVTTPATVEACPPLPGALGGVCSTSFKCNVTNSICTSDICTCNAGYTQSGQTCVANDDPSSEESTEEGSNSAMVIAIGVAVGFLVLIGIIIALALLYKERIRKKFCPKEEPDMDKAIPIPRGYSGPSPGNTKFPGRDPLATQKRKTLPPIGGTGGNLVDHIYKEQAEDMKITNPLENGHLNGAPPVFVRPGEDNVVRTRFTRSARKIAAVGAMNGIAHSHSVNENNTKENSEKQRKREKKERKRKKKKDKIKKVLRNGTVGITAVKGFELPQQGTEGFYRRNSDLGHPPPFIPPGAQTLPSPSAQQLSRSMGANMSRPKLPPMASSVGPTPRGQWKMAGIASMMAGQHTVMRRTSRLDITNVNEPGEVETTEQEF